MLTSFGVSTSGQQARTPVRVRDLVELGKPLTWFPPMWAFACGVISAGWAWGDVSAWRLLLGVLIAGPGVCAASQMVNDWFDRHVDAINEPQRPIPSGRLAGRTGLHAALGWTLVAALASLLLGLVGFTATIVALLLAWGYSAPPVRFKQNGWIGNGVVGLSYEGLAWVAGATVATGGRWPTWPVLALALAYSVGAHGIMTLNDFKSMDGDRRVGILTVPVHLGARGGAIAASAIMLLAQLCVVALLVVWGARAAAVPVALLVLAQVPLMAWFVARPVERAVRYSAAGVGLYVLGMMVSAFVLRHVAGGAAA